MFQNSNLLQLFLIIGMISFYGCENIDGIIVHEGEVDNPLMYAEGGSGGQGSTEPLGGDDSTGGSADPGNSFGGFDGMGGSKEPGEGSGGFDAGTGGSEEPGEGSGNGSGGSIDEPIPEYGGSASFPSGFGGGGQFNP